jgi:CO/xanthine dehydrogenase FAD-binding subunit
VPVLIALSAQVGLTSTNGSRLAPLSELYTGKGESPFNIMPEEILTEIRIPLPWAPIGWSYQRIAAREAVDFPLANAAAVAMTDKGRVDYFRLVLSAVGPAPIVVKEAESLIKGSEPSPDMPAEAEGMALRAAEGVVVGNASASKEYRVTVAGVMARRAVQEALQL